MMPQMSTTEKHFTLMPYYCMSCSWYIILSNEMKTKLFFHCRAHEVNGKECCVVLRTHFFSDLMAILHFAGKNEPNLSIQDPKNVYEMRKLFATSAPVHFMILTKITNRILSPATSTSSPNNFLIKMHCRRRRMVIVIKRAENGNREIAGAHTHTQVCDGIDVQNVLFSA